MTPSTLYGHVWRDDGQLEDGTPTHRCVRCAVRGHWPAAEWRCALYPEHLPPLMMTRPALHADQWQPPFMPSPALPCAMCSRRFFAPLHARTTTVCSSACARARKAIRDRARRNGALA